MNATIHTFPNQGNSAHLPSLGEMCHKLRFTYSRMDEIDREFFHIVNDVCRMGEKAKIEAVMECRAIAWSMLNRYGVSV